MELQGAVWCCKSPSYSPSTRGHPSPSSHVLRHATSGAVVQVSRGEGADGSSSTRRMGATVQVGKELISWKTCSLTGGTWGTVELQEKTLWRNKRFQRWSRVVANSAKEEKELVEVDSGVGSSQDAQRASKTGGGSSLLTFLCPLLKLIGGGDPAAPRNAFFESATSGAASLARLPWGSQVDVGVAAERNAKGQPPQLFQLYEFEACPFCRRVREALTELDLSAEVYPCPKGSLRHREFVQKNGGKEQFPYFVDPNTGVSLYESSEIVNYLFKEYGGGRKPTTGLLESTLVTGWVPTIVRAGRGMMLYSKATSDPPPNKLELFSYENNQFARLVREALCELELPYILRNSGKGSSSRNSLLQLAGSTQVPYLVDPNTGKSMAESLNIIAYLFETYGANI